jgi:hypothetical protein
MTLDELISGAQNILGSSTGKGAALGALAGQLLSSYGQGAGGVNLGVDMSKVGNIPTRALTAYQPKYRTYAEYGARDLPMSYVDPALAKVLGVSSAIPTNLGGISQYTARPASSNVSPLTITSPGSGAAKLISPSLTPTSDTTINPLVGALMGSAIGYLSAPTSTTTQASVQAGAAPLLSNQVMANIFNPATVKSALSNIGNILSGSGTTSGGANIISSNDQIPGVIDSGGFTMKDGGMTTPLMAADGGAVDGYYTYGDQINPADVLSGYAHGGETHPGGLQSMVEGRVDFRDGSAVNGAGDGQSDDIPAMLADGEFVIDSETVAQLGNGSTKAGANLLDEFRKAVREHKRSAPVDEIPPPSSPLQYMKTAMANAKEKNRG